MNPYRQPKAQTLDTRQTYAASADKAAERVTAEERERRRKRREQETTIK